MNNVIAGIFSGLIMSSLSMVFGSLYLFSLVKSRSHTLNRILNRISPIYITLGLLVISYPVFKLVGVLLGFFHLIVFSLLTKSSLIVSDTIFMITLIILVTTFTFIIKLISRTLPIIVIYFNIVFVLVYGLFIPLLTRLSV